MIDVDFVIWTGYYSVSDPTLDEEHQQIEVALVV